MLFVSKRGWTETLCALMSDLTPSEMLAPPEDFCVDTGKAEGGTFVRVRHLPSGSECSEVTDGSQSLRSVIQRLCRELAENLEAGAGDTERNGEP